MGNIIFDSTWDAIKKWKWGELRNHQWKDFALVVFDTETGLEVKGVKLKRGKVELVSDTELKARGIAIEQLDKKILFEATTEMNVAIFVSDKDFYSMMMYHLPWYDKLNLTFQNNCRVMDISFRYLEEQIARVKRNLFLDTAIEMLPMFERALDIKTDPHISFNQRRNQVRTVMNLMHSQINEDRLKELCSAFSNNNAGVEISKSETVDVFEIKFVANGLPNNLSGLTKMLEKMFPADLTWEYTYTQDSWKDKEKVKWRDMEPYTWTQFNEYSGYKEVS